MTELLTPEQVAEFREYHQLAEAMDAHTIAHRQRGLLLRDREAICERLETMRLGKKLNKSHYEREGDKRLATIYHGQELELSALLSELRGGE